MADVKNWILLKNAANEAIYPQIDLRNVRKDTLLELEKVEGLVDALNAKLAAATFTETIANYSTTAEVTKAITDAIGEVQHFAVEVVTELPAVSEAEPHTIYLVGRSAGVEADDVYDEYILINGKFELIGNTELDLSNYYTIKEVDDALALKVDKTTTINSKALSGDIVLDGNDIALGEYALTDSTLGFAASTKITDAFEAIDAQFASIVGGGEGGDDVNLTGINVRLTAAEGAIDTLEDIVDGYTGKGSIKAAVDAKADAADVTAAIGEEGTITKAVAANAAAIANVYTKAEVDTLLGEEGIAKDIADVAADLDVVEKALTGLLTEGAVKAAIDLKADKTYVDGIVGTEGSLTKAVEANTAAVATKAEKTYVDGIVGADGSLTKSVEANAAAVATKAEKADVEAVIGTEGSLTKAVEANTAALALAVYYEEIEEIEE